MSTLIDVYLFLNLFGYIFFCYNQLVRIVPFRVPLYLKVVIPTLFFDGIIELSPLRSNVIEFARSIYYEPSEIRNIHDALYILKFAEAFEFNNDKPFYIAVKLGDEYVKRRVDRNNFLRTYALFASNVEDDVDLFIDKAPNERFYDI